MVKCKSCRKELGYSFEYIGKITYARCCHCGVLQYVEQDGLVQDSEFPN
jgi:hypothetical protein